MSSAPPALINRKSDEEDRADEPPVAREPDED
jgi:hypothetical protein